MTVELITGFAGTPHISSDEIGAFQAGLVGPGDYALATGDSLKATMSNANTIAVQSGDAVLNGRHVHLAGTTTATVQSGTQGQKRNDIAVLRYSKNTTTGVETCQLVVIKGTPTTGTPADPAHNTGSILSGVATHDMPLYRIPLNGITVGTLVPLFNVLKPMKDVWDSLTRDPLKDAKTTIDGWTITLTHQMGRVYALEVWKTGRFGQSNLTVNLPVSCSGTIGLACAMLVGDVAVATGLAELKGSRLSMSLQGYPNDSSVVTKGLIITA